MSTPACTWPGCADWTLIGGIRCGEHLGLVDVDALADWHTKLYATAGPPWPGTGRPGPNAWRAPIPPAGPVHACAGAGVCRTRGCPTGEVAR